MIPDKQILSLKKIEKVLRSETMGFLGLSDNGMPYVVPMTYAYSESKILLHCAQQGKKMDYIRKNPQVCFTIGRQYGKTIRHPQGAKCHVNHDSVICYGIARVIDELDERTKVLNVFNRCLQPDAGTITKEEVSNCFALEIKIHKMTCRQQRRGTDHIHREYKFDP